MFYVVHVQGKAAAIDIGLNENLCFDSEVFEAVPGQWRCDKSLAIVLYSCLLSAAFTHAALNMPQHSALNALVIDDWTK